MRRTLVCSVLILAVAGAAGCAGGTTDTTAVASPSGTGATGGCALTAADAWVKAADSGMTAAFGKLTNTGSGDETITGASSPLAARVEIHEMVDKDGSMVMQPKEGGLSIPAGSTHELAPGADHLMLIDLTGPVEAGASVTITLTCASGGQATVVAQAKTFTGAEEQYVPSASPSGKMSESSPAAG